MVEERRTDRRLLLARMRWRAAEERIYPLALADVVSYQEAVTRVGLVLKELRSRYATEIELLACEDDPELLAVGDAAGPVPVRAADIVAAACALRGVELAARHSSSDSPSASPSMGTLR